MRFTILATMAVYLAAFSPLDSLALNRPLDAQLGRHRTTRRVASRKSPTENKIADHFESSAALVSDWSSGAPHKEVNKSAEGRSAQTEVQQHATLAVMRAFEPSIGGLDRATVVMPSGAGKTVTGLRIVEGLAETGQLETVLVLLPTLDLVSQAVREWRRWANQQAVQWSFLAVCSQIDEIATRTTDPGVIAGFLERTEDVKVVFSTYHSWSSVANAQRLISETKSMHSFGLIICDEAHCTAGKSGKFYSQPLFDVNIRAQRRLFLTATPRVYNTREGMLPIAKKIDKDDTSQALVASMDDESIYGPVVFRLGVTKSNELGITVPLKVVTLEIGGSLSRLQRDDPTMASRVKTAMEQLKKRGSHTAAEFQELSQLVFALMECHQKYGVRNAFSFHSDNARARTFQLTADTILATTATSSLECDRVDGYMAPKARRKILQDRKSADLRVVANALVLTTGVDVPSVDMVLFADAKRSHVGILQAMGRAARAAEGKTMGYVLVPVQHNDLASSASSSWGGSMIDIMGAFVSMDKELREALTGMVYKSSKSGRLPSLDDWPIQLRQRFELDSMDPSSVAALLEQVYTASCSLVELWHQRCGLLARYKEREGHANVPVSHEEDGIKLGSWLSNQRTDFKTGKLGPERQERLESLGVLWDPIETRWERNFELLVAYHSREGHTNVPQAHQEGGIYLGKWLSHQRANHKKGQMDRSRQERLESLGMLWDLMETQWEHNFGLLSAYHAREGHANLPLDYQEEGVMLGVWLNTQRIEAKRNKLDKSRREQLESLGVAWDPAEAQWERNFCLLTAYRKREGHADVPQAHEEEGVKLGSWLNTQRKELKKNKLDQKRKERLESLGVLWDPKEVQWERNFDLLSVYHAREGHVDVSFNHEEEGISLGTWLSAQRQDFKKGKLSDVRQKRLELLGITWDPTEAQWERNYNLLKVFREREGHANVPRLHNEDGVGLGTWVVKQRKDFKEGKLAPARQGRLELLGISWSPLEAQWERNFDLLKAFRAREGHVNVPAMHVEEGLKLGTWLRKQQQDLKVGKLDGPRKERLKSLLDL